MSNSSESKRSFKYPIPGCSTRPSSATPTHPLPVNKSSKQSLTVSSKNPSLTEVLNKSKKKGTKKTHFERTPFFRFNGTDYEPKRALGVDQGYANCGYSVIEWSPLYKEPVVLKMGVIKTPSSLEMGKRLQLLYEELKAVAIEYHVEALGCERLFVNPPKKESDATEVWTRNKSASIVDASMVTGVLFLLGSQLDLWTQDYVPGTIKKRVTGNGRASKDLVYERVRALIPESFLLKKRQPKNATTPALRKPEDHETDSIGIGITTIKEYYEYLEQEKHLKG